MDATRVKSPQYDEDGFILVSRRRAAKKSLTKKRTQLLNDVTSINTAEENRKTTQRIQSLIPQCKDEIKRSQFWKDFGDTFESKNAKDETDSGLKDVITLNDVKDIICYGIGNPVECPDSRYQFAFLLLLQEYLKVETCLVYDPCLTEIGREVIKNYGVSLILENEECKRKAEKRSLYVMIHCGLPMYENVLEANWGSELGKVIILGNRFSSYLTRMPSSKLKRRAPHLHHILPFTREVPLQNTFTHMETFVNTGFHFFDNVQDAITVECGDMLTCSGLEQEDNDEENAEIIKRSTVATFVGNNS